MMTREEITGLIEKITSGVASDEEMIQYNSIFRSFLAGKEEWDEGLMGDKEEVKARIFEEIERSTRHEAPRSRAVIWRKWSVAAAITLLLGTGIYYLLFYRATPQRLSSQEERFRSDVPAPAGNRAVLTLSNGRQVLLDSAANGTIAMQGHVSVTKLANGQISYTGSDDHISMHTISNPRGSKPLLLQLADGTRVWLNVASSLRYPTAFKGRERKVEITGEAYFEVAPDADMPFTVDIGSYAQVEVLGTDFNIKAYGKSLEATLLTGGVRVLPVQAASTGGSIAASGQLQPMGGLILKPGQQASVEAGEKIRLVQGVDTDQVLAWKNGLFYFNGNDIRQIMTELERYYDVEVAYEATVSDLFVAKLPRDLPVSEVLKLLEMTNQVHFKIEERKIIVMK